MMRTRLAALVAVACAVQAVGCAGIGARTVTAVGNIAGASDAPQIDSVLDLGDLERLPEDGTQVATTGGDGLFAVGEAMLIEGDDFGKQPTVLVDNRPATVIARTGAGGIVTRVPPQVASGRVEVVVSNARGRSAAPLSVTRHVLALQPNEGRVHVLTIEPGGHVDIANILPMPGAIDLVFSPDGQMAYVLQRRADEKSGANLVAVAMGAAGGPRVVNQLSLDLPDPRFLVASRDGRAVFAVGARRGVGIDVVVPRSPAAFEPFALRLAPASSVPIAVALSPDGSRLAALLAKDNQLAVYDVSDASNPSAPFVVEVAPVDRSAAAVDVGFAPDGSQVWIVLGDRPGADAGARSDTAVVAVDIAQSDDDLELRPRPAATVDGARAPVTLAVPRSRVGAGTSIRSAGRQATVLLSTVRSNVLATAAAPLSASAGAMLADSGAGSVLRCNLEGETVGLFETDGPVTGVAATPDGRIAVATTTRVIRTGDAYRLEFGVYVGDMNGSSVRYTRLADVAPAAIMLARAPVLVAP